MIKNVPIIGCHQEIHFKHNGIDRLKVEEWKKINAFKALILKRISGYVNIM